MPHDGPTACHPTTGLPLRVAVAEDGGLFREGLVMLLEATGHTVVGAVADGDSLMALLSNCPADVAILDIRMPPEPDGGLSTAKNIREEHPGVALLLLSHYAEAHYLIRVLEVGTVSVGYRLKDSISSGSALRETLLRLLDGEIVIEPQVAARLVAHRPAPSGDLDRLTDREHQVLGLMAEGHSNAGIGAALFLSTKAVEKHVAAIFAKLRIPSDSTSYHRRVLAVLAFLRLPDEVG